MVLYTATMNGSLYRGTSRLRDQDQRADIIEKTHVGLGKFISKPEISHALCCDRSEQYYCSGWYDTGLLVGLPVQDSPKPCS
jgi:hypothetical protein